MIKLKQSLIIFLTFILLILVMLMVDGTFFAPKRIKVKENQIVNPKIPETEKGFKIVYFSDVHYNLFMDESRFQKVVDKINATNPDVVLFGGDLIDHLSDNPLNDVHQTKLVNLLRNIKAPSGKFYVSGHFESDSNYAKTLTSQLFLRSEFEGIDDKVIKLYFGNKYVTLSGLANLATKELITKQLQSLNPKEFNIVIAHQPLKATLVDPTKVDLMITGFTHGGQINFPGFSDVFINHQPYAKGTHLIKTMRLDVSNGIGTSEIDVRLFADPEIHVYVLKAK